MGKKENSQEVLKVAADSIFIDENSAFKAKVLCINDDYTFEDLLKVFISSKVKFPIMKEFKKGMNIVTGEHIKFTKVLEKDGKYMFRVIVYKKRSLNIPCSQYIEIRHTTVYPVMVDTTEETHKMHINPSNGTDSSISGIIDSKINGISMTFIEAEEK